LYTFSEEGYIHLTGTLGAEGVAASVQKLRAGKSVLLTSAQFSNG
jgi:hypothetical protein